MPHELRLVPPTFFTWDVYVENGGEPGGTLVWLPADDFGAYARRLREGRNLSLRQAAERIGVSHPFVGQIERGVAKTLQNLELLERIAHAYDADLREVLEAAGARYAIEDERLKSARATLREMLVRLFSHPTVGLSGFHPDDMSTLPDFWAERIFELAQGIDTHARVGGDPVRDILKGAEASEA